MSRPTAPLAIPAALVALTALSSPALSGAALAAEPAWVQTFDIGPTAGPPTDDCASVVDSRSPNGSAPPTTSEAAPTDAATMLHYDMAPGATNSQLPPELQAALQLGRPFDLAAVPLEPLRGNTADIDRVRAVLRSAARQDHIVRIAAWGASHVAGEYLTGELRRVFEDRYGDAGHGFVMPAAPWKGYRQTDMNLCTRGAWVSDYVDRPNGRGDGLLGPGGISVEASTPASSGWVQTAKSNPHGRAVSRFEVMFLRQPGGGSVDLTVDSAPPVRVQTGASVNGPGAAILRVADGPHRLTVTPAGDGPVRLFGVNLERDTPGVVLDAAGVVGRTASSWLHWDQALQGAFLARRMPDLAILAYGTNEANDGRLTPEGYRATLRSVLTRMRAVMPKAACILVGPSDRGKLLSGTTYVIWSRTEWVARVQREVGPEFGCATWDVQAATGGPGSVFRWREHDPVWMAGDLIHFSAEGYKEVAHRLLGALDTQ